MTIPAGNIDSAMRGALNEPATPEGRRLLEIIGPHLGRIDAAAEEQDRDGSFPAEIFKGFVSDGVLAATVPPDLGGLGVGSVHDVALAVMRIAEVDASTAISLHMQLSRGLTMTYEYRHGSAAARALGERILRIMGTGEAIVSGALKDAGRPTELIPANGSWTLSGRKILVSMAPVANYFVVHAEARAPSGPQELASAFLPAQTPGLTVLDNWDGLGMRASASSEVVFDQCPVPAEDVIVRGTAGQRNDAALAGPAVSAIGLLGVYAGIAQSARDIAVSQIRRRPTTAPSAARTLVAEIDAKLYGLRTALAAALVNTDYYAYRFTGDPAERGRLMMMPFQYAKLVVNRAASAIVEDCMTLVGGASYTGRHPLARRYRDVRAGWFMHPFTYADAVDHLSAWALGLD